MAQGSEHEMLSSTGITYLLKIPMVDTKEENGALVDGNYVTRGPRAFLAYISGD